MNKIHTQTHTGTVGFGLPPISKVYLSIYLSRDVLERNWMQWQKAHCQWILELFPF